LRNLDPFADVEEDEGGLEENELVLEDCDYISGNLHRMTTQL